MPNAVKLSIAYRKSINCELCECDGANGKEKKVMKNSKKVTERKNSSAEVEISSREDVKYSDKNLNTGTNLSSTKSVISSITLSKKKIENKKISMIFCQKI